MTRIKPFIIYWLPVIVWMAAIFIFSSRPQFGLVNDYFTDFVLFKLLHSIEYAFLYFLWLRALNKTTSMKTNDQLIVALYISIFFAISDEIHQYFVPTREGKIRDIAIDIAGISIMYWYIKTHFKYVVEKLL